MNTLPHAALRLLFATGLLALLAACGSKDADLALLAEPAVGDHYAAELTRYSEFDFNDDDGKVMSPAYGLLRVVEVDASQVVVVTVMTASGRRSDARDTLRGDLSKVAFDPEERISVPRAELAGHYGDGRIFGVRR